MNIEITRKDLLWSYLSQLFQFGAGFFLLPAVLIHFTADELALWYVFLSVTAFVNLFDFGLQPTIMRNVSYIFSGAKNLAKEGTAEHELGQVVDYQLLFSFVGVVKKIYCYVAMGAFLIFATFGTWYVVFLVGRSTDVHHAFLSWVLYLLSAVLNLYFFYYTPLLLGRGKVMESHKTIVFSKVTYMVISVCLLFSGFGLVSLAVGNFCAVLVNRITSYRYFYDTEIKDGFKEGSATEHDAGQLFSVIWHNSKKMGLVTIGVFLILKTNLLIGGIFLPLKIVAAYGLTLQIFDFLLTVSRVLFQAYLPQFNSLMLQQKIKELKGKFLFSMGVGFLVYSMGVFVLLLAGNYLLRKMGSDTELLTLLPLLLCVLLYLIEITQGNCAILLTTSNRVPFVNATLITGGCIVAISFFLLGIVGMGVEGLFISTIVCQLTYNAWKWPLEVARMLSNRKSL